MPYQPHLRIQMGGIVGTLATPLEEWSVTFNTNRTTLPDDAAMDDLTAGLTTWFQSSGPRAHEHLELGWVKASACDATNHVVGPVQLRHGINTFGEYTDKFPPQIAVRASLQGFDRGRSNQGGFFWPGGGFTFDAPSQGLATAERDAFATSLKTLYDDLGGSWGMGNMVIASKIGNVPLKSVRVGSVFDTIRRRRDELVEVYHVVDL